MYMDIKTLLNYRERGLISLTRHPKYNLILANYTAKCQAERAWDRVTMRCRGLVVDEHGWIRVYPFQKFFNLAEHVEAGQDVPQEPFTIYEKVDGSLVTVTLINGEPLITTRGSFASKQVMLARELLDRVYGYDWLVPDYTYCFELVHPDNRIVVDYGGRK